MSPVTSRLVSPAVTPGTFRVKAWPRPTSVELPTEVFTNEDECEFEQKAYNDECAAREKAKREATDRQKKWDDDGAERKRKAAEEAKKEEARKEEARKEKLRETEWEKARSESAPAKTKGSEKARAKTTGAEKKEVLAKKSSSKKDVPAEKNQSRKKLVKADLQREKESSSEMEEVVIETQKKARKESSPEKRRRAEEEKAANFEAGPSREQVERLGVLPLLMAATNAAARMCFFKSPVVQQRVGQTLISANNELIARTEREVLAKNPLKALPVKTKLLPKSREFIEESDVEVREKTPVAGPSRRIEKQLVTPEHSSDESAVIRQRRKGKSRVDDTKIKGFPVRLHGHHKCWNCGNPRGMYRRCWVVEKI